MLEAGTLSGIKTISNYPMDIVLSRLSALVLVVIYHVVKQLIFNDDNKVSILFNVVNPQTFISDSDVTLLFNVVNPRI
jgi:hypothetical protein